MVFKKPKLMDFHQPRLIKIELNSVKYGGSVNLQSKHNLNHLSCNLKHAAFHSDRLLSKLQEPYV